jgi:O-antigen/teichoic acid export membrane protein
MAIRPLRALAEHPLYRHRPSGAFLRTGTVVFAAVALTALIGIAALRVYTHLASAEVFGSASLVLGVLGLSFQFLAQPVVSTQLRYHTEATRAGFGESFTVEVLRFALLAAAIMAGVLLLGFALWRTLVGGGGFGAGGMLAAAIVWAFVYTARCVFAARVHAEQRMASFSVLRVAEALLVAIVTGTLLAWSARAEAFVWGQVAGACGAVLLIMPFMPWTARGTFARAARSGAHAVPDFRKRLWSYGAPFAPMAALTLVANLGDRYVLAALLGTAAVGQYIAAFTIASQGFMLSRSALGDLFRPKLFDAESTGDRGRARRLFLAWLAAYAAVSLLGLLIIAVLGEWIVWLVLAEPYRAGAVKIMLWIGFGYGISGLTTVLENRMLSLGHSVRLLWPVGAGAAANVAFAYALVPVNGIVGAAQATCLSFLLQLMLTAVALRRTARRPSVLSGNLRKNSD